MRSILNDLFYNPDEIHEALLRDSPACAPARVWPATSCSIPPAPTKG